MEYVGFIFLLRFVEFSFDKDLKSAFLTKGYENVQLYFLVS